VIETIKSETDKYIKDVKVTLTWTDEPDSSLLLIQYENQPDTFSINIEGANSSAEGSGSNSHGDEGSATASLSFDLEQLSEIISSDGDEFEVTVTITLDEAGDQETNFGVFGEADDGNDFDYDIEIIWLVPED
jgi:hypothetical protein